MFARSTVATLPLAWFSVAACTFAACTFGGDSRPEPLGLGEQPQAEGGAPPLDEPLGPMDDDGDDAGPVGTDDGSAPGSTGAQSPAPTGDPPEGSGTGDSGAETGAAEDAPDPPAVDCSAAFSVIAWAADATVTEPMALATAGSAVGDPAIAISTVAEEGTVTFEVEVLCAGDYYVHGLVWDLAPGAWSNPDADSLFVAAAQGEEFVWRYGCQTLSLNHAMSWQPLAALEAQPCDVQPVVVSVAAAGTTTFTFRNREPGYESAVAGIGAIAVSNAADYDPYLAYDPYGQ